ncbi:hypothetical protein RJ639_028970 [Escallonia herrerae]|uniref:High light inducible protein n=1 Tax=Escallonia herrerae TaxID=1293975 RepID=A0AA88X6Q7_9ASTE|nr:hypothetical protein RJ639_028970 [Escallonia herrerae]
MLAFSGPAPEIINGRLAMTGFVVAIEAELASGEDVPLFKGVNVASKTDRFMTSNAKLWNGRFAMLGLVALAFTEFVKSGALV